MTCGAVSQPPAQEPPASYHLPAQDKGYTQPLASSSAAPVSLTAAVERLEVKLTGRGAQEMQYLARSEISVIGYKHDNECP